MILLTDTIAINGPIESAFEFFQNMDAERYRAWHPEDHVTLRWLRGSCLEEGNRVYCEEYIHGKIHKLTFDYVKVIPNRYIEYQLSNPIWRLFCPRCLLRFDPIDADTFTFTAEIQYRLGPLAARSKGVREKLKTVEVHQQEEGINLKQLIENDQAPIR